MKIRSATLVSAGVLFLAACGSAAASELITQDASIYSASCTTGTTAAFPGGFRADRSCNNRAVSGVASSVSDALNNAQLFGNLGAAGGRYCNLPINGMQSFPGGYVANFSCGVATLGGVGSTATDTGVNALAFANLENQTGLRCRVPLANVSAFAGGYIVNAACGNWTISGVGNTAKEAGVNALGFATVHALGGRRCTATLSDIDGYIGGALVTFRCNGARTVSGVGSNVADAAASALDFAS